MKVSVIVSTYNQPKWLEKTLWGFSVQSNKEFEIVIADDGSESDTLKTISNVANETHLQINHIWQEDRGFRKCRVLNKAILASHYDYLIFTDGDCIPHPNFVKNHVRLCEKQIFLSGGYIKLPLKISQSITKEDILFGNSTRPSWLIKQGLPTTHKLLKIVLNDPLAAFFDLATPTRATWNGHSASTWKKHILAAGGFDERMSYGGEDREFGERLENSGIKGKQVRHRCTSVHLEHPRPYVSPDGKLKNKLIRNDTAKFKKTYTDYGI